MVKKKFYSKKLVLTLQDLIYGESIESEENMKYVQNGKRFEVIFE
jgi:hypothetical protein